MQFFDERKSGVLMPIYSLPSKTGIGTLGKSAYDFIDFLSDSGQAYWQILPIQPPAKANSPYLTFSASAGNPYLIDLEWLVGDGFLKADDLDKCGVTSAPLDCMGANKEGSPYPSGKINYNQISASREKIFGILYENFFTNPPKEYFEFCKKQAIWLNNYSLFMAIKWTLAKNNNIADLSDDRVSVQNWPDKLRYKDKETIAEFRENHTYEINYYKMLQFFFYWQWTTLRKYAHKKNIKIIGDIPFYVALDSADTWGSPKNFKMNPDFTVETFSGCPPNKANNKDSVGQVWDGPVYDWDYLKKTNYKWWIGRIQGALYLYDIIRIDHFKAFESYYCIDAKTRDATAGHWTKGAGLDFWLTAAKTLGYKKISDMPILAEDLGVITPPLKKLLKDTGFPGMKILQFAFNETRTPEKYIGPKRLEYKNMYLPHSVVDNCVAYVGSHDNNTLAGWINNIRKDVLKNAQNFYVETNKDKLFDKMFFSYYNGPANTCIIAAQDLLKLGADARSNTPGTVGINWMWQMTEMQFCQLDAEKLKRITGNADRL